MRGARRAARWLLLSCVLAFGAERDLAAAGPDVMSVDSDKMDQVLAGQTVLEFVVLPTGEISTEDGSVIAPKDLPKHLKRVKAPRDAFYLFWLVNPKQLEVAKNAIERCSRYGATKFAVRQMPVGPKPADSTEDQAQPGPKSNRTMIFTPGENPHATGAGEDAPAFSGRPAELRPPPLPTRVRCEYAADAAVVAAADRARTLLIGAEPIDPAWLGESMFIQPGAWKHLRRVKALAQATSIAHGVQMSSGPIKLEARFLRTPEETIAAAQRVREIIQREGGGVIRALTAGEMDAWWTFIAFDIEEPVFVLATKGGRFRFIVHFNDDGRLTLIDELNALPAQ